MRDSTSGQKHRQLHNLRDAVRPRSPSAASPRVLVFSFRKPFCKLSTGDKVKRGHEIRLQRGEQLLFDHHEYQCNPLETKTTQSLFIDQAWAGLHTDGGGFHRSGELSPCGCRMMRRSLGSCLGAITPGAARWVEALSPTGHRQ